MKTATIFMPSEMVAALRQLAGDEDTSVGNLIRDAIKRDLYRRSRAKTARRADERLVAPLRALLADDPWPTRMDGMTCKRGWHAKVISCAKRAAGWPCMTPQGRGCAKGPILATATAA